jgi:exo-beta-1,3-glucanase (GH17 family)
MYGLCLSPYKDGNRPPDYVPVEQIRERLEIIAPYIEWVRSFSATRGLEEIPEEAKKLGLKVAMGAWIRHEEVRDEEIDNLIEKAEAGYVDVAVVGNEELWWREAEKADAIEPNVLVEALETVRQRLDDANLSHIPVTTADPWDALFKRDGASFKYQEVLDAVDVFYVNMYPFHEHAHISRAIEKLDETFSGVLKDANEAGPGKEVIIGETGWPSEEEHWGPAEPSSANAARYFYEAQCWAARNGVKMFWFAPFDEKWKAEPPPDRPNEDPPDFEAHWGVWDSNGVIKQSFLPEHVFCEDFDPCANTFCAYTDEQYSATEPNILGPDANSSGQFLRVLYDGVASHLSSAAFDRAAPGPFSRIVAEFDFRMLGDGNNGDGFSFLLLPTSRDGTSGCHKYYYLNLLAEEPNLADTFAVGFEICDDWPCSSYPANRIYISWDGKWYPDGGPIEVSPNDVNLDSGEFHRVRIDLISCGDEDTGLVTVLITPDIYDANHPPAVTVAENVAIGDAAHPYKPYENRIEFAGRNGVDANTNTDIDNIYVSYTTEFCGYFLEGDVTGDCRIDLFDLASLANNWLVNCNSSPVNEECMPE